MSPFACVESVCIYGLQCVRSWVESHRNHGQFCLSWQHCSIQLWARFAHHDIIAWLSILSSVGQKNQCEAVCLGWESVSITRTEWTLTMAMSWWHTTWDIDTDTGIVAAAAATVVVVKQISYRACRKRYLCRVQEDRVISLLMQTFVWQGLHCSVLSHCRVCIT